MKKQHQETGYLELGHRSVPLPTRRRISNGLRKGCRVKLLVKRYLEGAYDLMGQLFPEGEIGQVIAQTTDEQMIVLFEDEEWLVNRSDIAPIESKKTKS